MLRAAWKWAVMVWQVAASPLVSMNALWSVMVFLLRVLLLWAMGRFIVEAVAPTVTTLEYLLLWVPGEGDWMNGERVEQRLCGWDGDEADETWWMSGDKGSSLPSPSGMQTFLWLFLCFSIWLKTEGIYIFFMCLFWGINSRKSLPVLCFTSI